MDVNQKEKSDAMRVCDTLPLIDFSYIRHGPSCGNLRVSGADPTICPLFPINPFVRKARGGVADQLHAITTHLDTIGWGGEWIFCSRMPRAVMTALIISVSWALKQTPTYLKTAGIGVIKTPKVIIVEELEEERYVFSKHEFKTQSHHHHYQTRAATKYQLSTLQEMLTVYWTMMRSRFPKYTKTWDLLLKNTQNDINFASELKVYKDTQILDNYILPENFNHRHKDFIQVHKQVYAWLLSQKSDVIPKRTTQVLVGHGNWIHNHIILPSKEFSQELLTNYELISPLFHLRINKGININYMKSLMKKESERLLIEKICQDTQASFLKTKTKFLLQQKGDEQNSWKSNAGKKNHNTPHTHPHCSASKVHLVDTQREDEAKKHLNIKYLGNTTWSFLHFFSTHLSLYETDSEIIKDVVPAFKTLLKFWLAQYPCKECRSNFKNNTVLFKWWEDSLVACKTAIDIKKLLIQLHTKINQSVACQHKKHQYLAFTELEADAVWTTPKE